MSFERIYKEALHFTRIKKLNEMKFFNGMSDICIFLFFPVRNSNGNNVVQHQSGGRILKLSQIKEIPQLQRVKIPLLDKFAERELFYVFILTFSK